MQNLPVNWYEGLFLRPQHFQATERHLGEVLTKSSRFDNAYNYGIANIQFNKESLANHRFELLALQARMRDGTIIDFDQSQQPDGVDMSSPETGHAELTSDLKKGLEAERTVTVYLGVPKLKLGRVNVGEEQGADDTRFVTTVSSKQDEGDGQSNQDIQFRQLNAKIVLSTENLSGLELLPLGRVSRVSESESLPRLDETFIPPLLSIDS